MVTDLRRYVLETPHEDGDVHHYFNSSLDDLDPFVPGLGRRAQLDDEHCTCAYPVTSRDWRRLWAWASSVD